MANIVVCSDGTWNRPEEDTESDYPTNVLKMARGISSQSNGVPQHVFYDWGLGSYHSKFWAGITGAGIHKNILDGYRYIVQNFDPGDNIYLFGFSRGAYTSRAIAGLINNCGILLRENANLIETAWQKYKSGSEKCKPWSEQMEEFRREHCHPERKVHFIGVWDTVGALGVPRSIIGLFKSSDEFYDTELSSITKYARHALAIDERREDFLPTLWSVKDGVDLKQVWFAGVHSDIGGSYPPDEGSGYVLADVSLEWMIREASAAGLGVEQYLSASLKGDPEAKKHKSRTGIHRSSKAVDRTLILVDKAISIHDSVRIRYDNDTSYRPPKLEALINEFGWDGVRVEK